MIEQTSEKDIKQKQNNHNDEEIEIDLIGILRKIIGIRKTIYKAAGIGLVVGIIVAISIPKQYTVGVTLSPEMGNTKAGGLSGLAASFLGSGMAINEGTDALNASLSADIVSSTPFLLELSTMKIPALEGETMTLNVYLDEESSPWYGCVTFMIRYYGQWVAPAMREILDTGVMPETVYVDHDILTRDNIDEMFPTWKEDY